MYLVGMVVRCKDLQLNEKWTTNTPYQVSQEIGLHNEKPRSGLYIHAWIRKSTTFIPIKHLKSFSLFGIFALSGKT